MVRKNGFSMLRFKPANWCCTSDDTNIPMNRAMVSRLLACRSHYTSQLVYVFMLERPFFSDPHVWVWRNLQNRGCKTPFWVCCAHVFISAKMGRYGCPWEYLGDLWTVFYFTVLPSRESREHKNSVRWAESRRWCVLSLYKNCKNKPCPFCCHS
jgi:hypothetical protein